MQGPGRSDLSTSQPITSQPRDLAGEWLDRGQLIFTERSVLVMGGSMKPQMSGMSVEKPRAIVCVS